jgi:two-component system, OmpR family, sensor histidine kinase KdpD
VRPRASRRLRSDPPSVLAGLVVAALAVAAITGLIFPLRQISPAASNGVAYLLAVLLVSTIWGLWLGVLTSLASAAAFNFFHLPPTGRFTIADSRHWVALAVFLVAAIMASAVAELARSRASEAEQRRREADLAAELARMLLGGATVEAMLGDASRRLADALGLRAAAIELGPAPGHDEDLAFELWHGDEQIGALVVPGDVPPRMRERLGTRVVPALEALLAAGLERDRLQAEVVETRALRRSDELKTALLRTVSHDLRTPLTAILTAGAALADGEISRADREELGRAIVEESERLTALVEKLLDLSRLQAGTAEPRPQWCSIDEILRETADELDPGGTRFALSIDMNLPLIRADAAQLERAFANLLENAARYSGEDRVSVRARVVGERLMVRIVDRGPGIQHEDLTRIFDAFYRAPAVRGGHTGSGLGLAIVKGFVEANGGRVWAESLPGQGTSFVVAFPVERDALEPNPADEVGLA